MKRILLALSIAVLLASSSALAQDEHPKFELFAGYSFLTPQGEAKFDAGYNFSVVYNVNRWLGVVTDFSKNIENNFDAKTYNLMIGPQVTYRRSGVQPFAHAMIGAQAFEVRMFGHSDRIGALAMAVGGGLDAGVGKHFAVRIIQMDYIRNLNADFHSDDSLRLSAGVVFRF